MIVKCQASLETTEPVRQMLFYSQHRNHVWQGDITPEWEALFNKYGPKFFAHVAWREDQPPRYGSKTYSHSW